MQQMHPLLAGLVGTTCQTPELSTLTRTAQALGFSTRWYTSYPVTELSIPESRQSAAEQQADFCKDGYGLAAILQDVGARAIYLFLRPDTPYAKVIWLAGLGVIEQAREVEKAWGHNARDADSFRGWHKVTEEAIAEAQKAAIESGRSQFEVKLFTLPVASRFVSAEDVLQQMYERAQDEAGECADDFPSYDRDSKDLLEGALSLLVDGWAVATDNVPTFSGDGEQGKTYDVFDPRSLAP